MNEARTLAAVLVAAIAVTACAASDTPPTRSPAMTDAQRTNKEVVRKLYERALNDADKEFPERSIAPDYVGGPRGDRGPAAFGRTVNELRAAFPDIHYAVEDLIAEGDRVAVRWTWTGTHRGPFRGLAPTGKRVTAAGFGMFQLRDGQIVRSWVETDRFGFLQQLGEIPPELSARIQPAPPAGR